MKSPPSSATDSPTSGESAKILERTLILVRKYRQRFHSQPNICGLQAADALLLLEQALLKNRPIAPEEWWRLWRKRHRNGTGTPEKSGK